jgi:hypothetical protein
MSQGQRVGGGSDTNFEEVLQPFLENIKEVGDEVFFQLPSTGKIYKLGMHADGQEGDLDDLKHNFEAQEEEENYK